MGERKGESEFDELEEILGEIPNVTSGCSHPKVSFIQKHSNSSSMDSGKNSVNKILQMPREGRSQDNDQSLVSAFSELSFGDKVTTYATIANGSFYKSLPNHKRPSITQPKSSSGLRNSVQENFFANVPSPYGSQGLQYFPDLPDAHVEYPLISNQQSYILEEHSRPRNLHSQNLSQPHITWGHVEEERYYRMQQEYLYWENQQQNRCLGAQLPIQVNETLISQNLIQPYYEQCYQKSPWDNFLVPMGVKRLNPCISCTGCHPPNILEKISKQNFVGKNLVRSHGLNSFRSANRRSLSNGKSLAPPNGEHLLLNGFISGVWSRENADVPQKYNLLDEVCGKIFLMAKDQNGCRYLQRKFEEGKLEDIEKIFLEIIDHIVELMTDPFGNYLVQKLLDVCNEDQRIEILQAVTAKSGDLVKISCDMHGFVLFCFSLLLSWTRAVQKIIETLKTPKQFLMVVSSLRPGIVTLIKNINGNHVALCCLQYLMPQYSEFLFEAVTANCVELAMDRHGCCVLQKCIGHSDAEQRRRLISEITSNALILSQDPFGNYVVQFVLELEVPWATRDILDQLHCNYGDLSVQKCSSNVVEKCLKFAGEERRSLIVQELIDNSRLDQIMQDPYGNYVIQAALNKSKGALHAKLVEAIRSHAPVLQTSPYGKKVLSSYSLRR